MALGSLLVEGFGGLNVESHDMEQTILKEIPIAPMAKFVQILEDGSEFVCDLPIGPNVNDGSGPLYYLNLGFVPFQRYQEEKQLKALQAAKKGK